jgi:hypothetical protein
MKRRFNWPLWTGLALAVVAFLSYFFFFARFPVTRDIPWASFLLFLLAILLLVAGWRRATGKIVPSIVTLLGVLILGAFTYSVTIGSKNLPDSPRAPAVGAHAPDFSLPDTNGRTVSLSQVISESNGVLLVFYRGYW